MAAHQGRAWFASCPPAYPPVPLARYDGMAMTVLFTRKDYEGLPEGTPVELRDGMLVNNFRAASSGR